MKTIGKSKRITQIYIILSIIIISNIFFIFPDGFLNNSQRDLNDDKYEENTNPLSILKTSVFGEADW